MFQLKVVDTDVSNGSVAVSWCLDAELIKYLVDQELVDPQVVIVVAPVNYNAKKETRAVVPLKDLMVYLELKCAGPNKIMGFVSHTHYRNTAKSRYLEKANGEYYTALINNYDLDGKDLKYSSWLLDDGNHKNDLSPPIEIDVPEGIFAPEPAKWEKAWVNHFFSDKLVDQCHFRRRRLFAYSVQPLIALAAGLFNAFFLILGLLTGARDWSIQYLLHPLIYYPTGSEDVFSIWRSGIIFVKFPDEEEDSFWKFILKAFWRVPFMPVVLFPVIALCYFGHAKQLGEVVALVIAATICFALLFRSVELIATGRFLKTLQSFKVLQWIEKLFAAKPNDELWYLNQDEMELIICGEKQPKITYATLPARHKSIRLRFQNLKSKVCRPFSQ